MLGSDPAETTEGLNAAAGMLRNHLFRELHIHTVPTLHFTLDESVMKGFEMDALIKKAIAQTVATEALGAEKSGEADEKYIDKKDAR